MTNILITGAGSYIGMSVERYLAQWPEKYQVNTLDMLDENWRKADFSSYDSVFHVAGIAHSDNGELTPEKERLYYRVNTDLAVDTAQKAKAEGAKQFIYMSSAIVYGSSAPFGQAKRITRETPVNPANAYGNSKVKAEEGLLPMSCDSFRVVILRPPMIYGPGSRGNYPTLAKLAVKLPVFPKVDNERSMLYIGNLAEFVRLMVENREKGIFWPQNREYVNTTDLAKRIAAAHGKKLLTVGGVSWALKLMGKATALVDKAFGSLSYDQELSRYKEEYRLTDFEKSILETEGKM